MVEKQELYCHNCSRYIQFELDLSMDGNHVLACPNCGHEHCRVVRNSKITEYRWDSRNGLATYYVSANVCNTTVASTYTSYNATVMAGNFMYYAWMNTTNLNS